MQKFFYKMIEDGTFCVMGYQGDEPDVIIPDSVGDSGRITVLYDKVFEGHGEITSVRLPDSITDIGEFVFEGCGNLRSLKLPPQLVNLWGYSFARCGIEEITIPDKVRHIPPICFQGLCFPEKSDLRSRTEKDPSVGFQRLYPACRSDPCS